MEKTVLNIASGRRPAVAVSAVKEAARIPPERFVDLAVVFVLLVGVLWAFWPTLATMAELWSTDSQYSHGFLVPLFALAILWSRRELFPRGHWQANWWGLPVLACGMGLRLISAYYYLGPLDGLALVATLFGVCLLVGGMPLLRWCWPALAFLGFMLPLPFRLQTALAQPLKRLATVASTYLLQTCGFSALSEGNVILIGDLRLGVIDACNGLGMLFTFFALSTAVAIIIRSPWMDKVLVILSAVPIALLVNILRITITAMAHVWFGSAVGHTLMHDFAGWIMMPMALGLVWLELWLLSRLLIPAAPESPVAVGVAGPTRPTAATNVKNNHDTPLAIDLAGATAATGGPPDEHGSEPLPVKAATSRVNLPT